MEILINLVVFYLFCCINRGGKFITVGDRIRLPDDVTMGYIIEHLLKKQLTVVEQFHSHLEPMKFLNEDTFHEQVIHYKNRGKWNYSQVTLDMWVCIFIISTSRWVRLKNS